jgi:hypothetical protein
MASNVSPHVRDMIAKRASAVGSPFTPTTTDLPLSTVEPDQPVNAAPDDELPPAPEVAPDPENDAPLEVPGDDVYRYETDVVVTPARARQLIDLNADNNRRRKESVISRFARDMRKGLWKSRTGETIKMSATGRLIDGQNRMHAVVRAGVPITFDIAWNVEDDRMLVIDGNSPRNTSDDFRITGVADRFLGGSLVRWVLAWEKGNYLNHGGRLTPTRSEVRERYLQEPHSFDQAAMFGKATRHQIGTVNPSAAALAYWLFSKMPDGGAEQAEKFFDAFLGGLGLEPGDPVVALRNRFISVRGFGLNRAQQLTLMIKAWNATRAGGRSSRIDLPKDGLTNENFPMPR